MTELDMTGWDRTETEEIDLVVETGETIAEVIAEISAEAGVEVTHEVLAQVGPGGLPEVRVTAADARDMRVWMRAYNGGNEYV